MSCDVRLLDAPPCIELTFVGTVTVDDVRLGFTEGSRLAHEHDVWHVLTDLSDVTSDPSVFALYDIATELAESGVAPRYREALVSPSGTHELQSAQFYEDAMVNRGLTARMFADRASALAWLSSQTL